jgi:hypothetical protein
VALLIEKYEDEGWVRCGAVGPGGIPGSLSDHSVDGTRQVVLFHCAPDKSYSVIARSRGGIDVEHGELRTISAAMGSETLATLRNGESFELLRRSESGRRCEVAC